MEPNGNTTIETLTVPPTSRATVLVNDTIINKAVASEVKCTNNLGIVVERSVYWDIPGVEWVGGHNSIGIPFTSTVWYMAEGSTFESEDSTFAFDFYTLIQNPTDKTAEIRVTYMNQNAETAIVEFNLGPKSRHTIYVDDIMPNDHMSTKIESLNGVGIAAERSMYWNSDGIPWVGGHCSRGVISPSTEWYLAEGSTEEQMESWVLIQNPNNETAEVEVTFMTKDGTMVIQNISLAPVSRYTISANTFFSDEPFSTKIESLNGVTIIAERAQYWDAGNINRAGGHSFHGVTDTAATWYLSEGATAGSFIEWILIQNPSFDLAEVTVTFMKSDETTVVEKIKVLPTSRYTLLVNDIIPDEAVSAQIESTNGTEIVVDRAMYWAPNSQSIETLQSFGLDSGDWLGGHSSSGIN